MDTDIRYYKIGKEEKTLRNDFIEYYHLCGYSSDEILGHLLLNNGVSLSKRQLWKILAERNVPRTYQRSDLLVVISSILELRREGGLNRGYRCVWQSLRTAYGLSVSQNVVRLLLKAIDPKGVIDRSRRRLQRRVYYNRGPNAVLHIDGYDKLKKFGICLHGAVDGFSRKIIWMKVCPSNNNPRIVARFYMDSILAMGGVPCIVRSDPGTENCVIRDLHRALRHNHRDIDALTCFRYGKSVHNQRIERMWGHMRGLLTGFWMVVLADVCEAVGFDNSDPVEVQCLRFCFLCLIQFQVDKVVGNWNQHAIRKQPSCDTPCGKPEILYFLPQAFGYEDCKMPLLFDEEEIMLARESNTEKYHERGCTAEFLQVADLVLGDSETKPTTVDQAIDLFVTFIRAIRRVSTNQ